MSITEDRWGAADAATAFTDRCDATDAQFADELARLDRLDVADEAVEAMARRFHEAYERLAPRFGYETRRESAVPWEQVPAQNRALMTAVCAELMPAPGTATSGQVFRTSDTGKRHESQS